MSSDLESAQVHRYAPSSYSLPPEADLTMYPDWVSPENIRDVIDWRQHVTRTTEVEEIVAIDVDDTIVPKDSNIARLYGAVESSNTEVDPVELKRLCETTRGFSPIDYLLQTAGEDGFKDIMHAYRQAYDPSHASPAAGRLVGRLTESEVPHFLFTYGEPSWQVPKIAGPGMIAIQGIAGALIVPERQKVPFLDTFHFKDEGYVVQQVDILPPARFVTRQVVLIDDSLASLAGFEKGFWLNESGPSGRTDLPEGITEVASLDEISVQDGVTIKVPVNGDQAAGHTFREGDSPMATMPVLNRDSTLASKVWAGYII